MCVELLKKLNAVAVATLDNELFTIMPLSPQLNVYDASLFTARGTITIGGSLSYDFVDMVACCFNHCLYIADAYQSCMIRLETSGMSELTKWKVEGVDQSAVISVTSSHHVLVLCGGGKLKLFSTDGVLHKAVELPPDLVHVTSAVELTPGRYVVSHGRGSDTLHRVCVVDNEGNVLRRFGGLRGSHPKLLASPRDVGVDKDGFVHVDDEKNDRLVVLTQQLDHVHCMPAVFLESSSDYRRRMKLDKQSGRIYAGRCYATYASGVVTSKTFCVSVFEI